MKRQTELCFIPADLVMILPTARPTAQFCITIFLVLRLHAHNIVPLQENKLNVYASSCSAPHVHENTPTHRPVHTQSKRKVHARERARTHTYIHACCLSLACTRTFVCAFSSACAFSFPCHSLLSASAVHVHLCLVLVICSIGVLQMLARSAGCAHAS